MREPAFGVIQTGKLQNPDTTMQQCLQMLQNVFRRPSQSGGAYYELFSTFQQKREPALAYLLHLEQVLQRVIAQGAISSSEINSIRLCQVQIGAWYSVTLIRDLNLAGRKSNPPGFSQLM